MRFEGGSAHEEQTNALYLDNGGYPAGFCAADAAVFQPIRQISAQWKRRTACWMQHQRTFSSAVYEMNGEWTFYPEVLGSGAELDAAQPGERDESIPYGSYRLKIHAQPKQYLTLGGYSFDYSTRVLVNGSEVLEIGKVGASAAESSRASTICSYRFTPARMARVEVVCQYANFVHREGGGLTQMHLSTAENIDRMRRSQNLYSLVLGGSLCLFGMYFLLFGVFRGEIKYVFPRGYLRAARPARPEFLCAASAACKLQLGSRISVSGADDYAAAVFSAAFCCKACTKSWRSRLLCGAMRCCMPCWRRRILSCRRRISHRWSRIGYYLSMPFFLYLVVQLIRRFWRIRRFVGRCACSARLSAVVRLERVRGGIWPHRDDHYAPRSGTAVSAGVRIPDRGSHQFEDQPPGTGAVREPPSARAADPAQPAEKRISAPDGA